MSNTHERVYSCSRVWFVLRNDRFGYYKDYLHFQKNPVDVFVLHIIRDGMGLMVRFDHFDGEELLLYITNVPLGSIKGWL